jgi:hypothetical protein
MGVPVPPFTGDKEISLAGIGPDNDIVITQDQPLPCTILGIFGDLNVPEE